MTRGPAERGSAVPGPAADRTPAVAAAILDTDGVITDTAAVHARLWKRLFDEFLAGRARATGETFEPFDPERDYALHVDGMSRHDGIRRFLDSRGIHLPMGSDDDAPDRETVAGLGERKNAMFTDWLAHNRVRTYPSTVALVQRLRAAGMPVAAFSASRNCGAVLRSAGLDDLFDARVDGNDAQRLGLPGKPDPAMLLEAARRLDAPPERTAAFEDSLAGIEAAAAGRFRPVIGIDRGGLETRLRQAGADVVVEDAGELLLDASNRLQVRRVDTLPSLWDRLDEFRDRIGGRRLILFLDYDGTLSPIVPDPDSATVPPRTRAALAAVAQRFPVAVISGRGLADLRERLGLAGVYHAGSHGFEIGGPGGTHTADHAGDFLPALDAVEQQLRSRLERVPGHIVERKPFAIAVHYRKVDPDRVAEVEGVVDEVLAEQPRLRKRHGKMVFQVQPRLDWHKGRAVMRLLPELAGDGDDTGTVAVYVGDDLTDEDVFRVLPGRGIGLVVRDGTRRTAADYALADPVDVCRFLELLAGRTESPASCRTNAT